MEVFRSEKLINPNFKIKNQLLEKKVSTPHDAALLTKTLCSVTGVT